MNELNKAIEPKDLLKSVTNLKDSYSSSTSEFCLTPKTIRDLLNDASTVNNIAYRFPHQGLELTFKDVYQRANVISQNFLKMGFVKGDRIAFILPNNHELVISLLAAMQIGLISTVLSPVYKIAELEFMFKKAGPKGVIIYDTFGPFNHIDIIRKLCPEVDSSKPGELKSEKLPLLKHVFILQNPLNKEKKTYDGTWEFDQLNEVLPIGLQNELPYLELDDPAIIMFTSGTTADPKGAVLSQNGFLNTVQLFLNTTEIGFEKEIYVIPVPIFHIFGILTGVFFPFCNMNKKSAVLADYFPKLESTLQAIDKYKCNMMVGTPTQYYDLLNSPDLDKYDITSLKYCFLAGSTVLIELVNKLKNRLNTNHIYTGFGLTESSGVHSVTVDYDKYKGSKYAYESCGRPLPFTETKIVDKNGKIVPLDTEGELYIRGFHLIKQYWNDPERTAEAIDKNGWLKTGDIFTMDSEGYLYFKSRRHDVIVRGGANIYPLYVENALKSHPEIIGAEAFGVPDDRMGDEICVWIILIPGSKLTDNEIRDYLSESYTDFIIPRYMKFVDKYPTNANNKVLKREMRKQSMKELNKE